MSAERPSTKGNGYWLAGGPGSLPPHAYVNYLSGLGSFDYGPEDFPLAPWETMPADDDAIFPVFPGGDPQTRNRSKGGPKTLNVLSMLRGMR